MFSRKASEKLTETAKKRIIFAYGEYKFKLYIKTRNNACKFPVGNKKIDERGCWPWVFLIPDYSMEQ